MSAAVTKVAAELREFADWMESEEGLSWAARKDKTVEGLRNSSILWLLDKQNEEDGLGVQLLRNTILCWAGEQGYPLASARLELLVKAVLEGDDK